MTFKSPDRKDISRASEGSNYEEALKQICERENGELLWLAEAIVGDPRAAGCCVAAAMLRACGSAYVAPNWRDRWIKRCVVREAVESNRAEIKQIAAYYIRDAICKRDPDTVDWDKQALRSLPAIKVSETLNIFERSALILHEYLGFSTHDCALLIDCHWSVIDSGCSNAAWRLFGERTNVPEKAPGIGFSVVMA
jgi:DNA-directed RNA polymerase specialized sigma24 family protein